MPGEDRPGTSNDVRPPEDDAPQRPLRTPRKPWRPPVDNATKNAFSRPEGVSGATDPRREERPNHIVSAPPRNPVHEQVFGKPTGTTEMLERSPSESSEDTSGRESIEELANPWRNPSSPVEPGSPARNEPPQRPVLDLVGRDRHDGGNHGEPRKLSVREVFFGKRLSWQAMASVGAACAVIGLVGGAAGHFLAESSTSLTSNDVRLREAPAAHLSEDNVIGAVADEVQPAVVNIQVTADGGMGEGSGIVIDDRGYILTNNHVVTMEGAAGPDAEIETVFASGQRANAEIVGTDPKTDLAVIKVDVENLTVAQLGNSDEVEVGQQIITIGSPLGLPKTVTQGIVSATQRAMALGKDASESGEVIDALQTDAAINPGNSGGPLVDTKGAVVGINTLIFSQSGGSDGLGFAIPINEAKRIAEALITDGEVHHATIGVNARTAANGSLDGAEIVNVVEGGPAQRGGMREGDVVVKVGDRDVHSSDELVVAVRNAGADNDVPVTVVRDGGRVELTVKPVAE